jgi:peptide deformylase
MASSRTRSKIVQYGDPVLRQPARRVGRVTPDVRQLVDQMIEVMRSVHGVGLAANQLGVPRRIAVIELDGEQTILVDPELVTAKGGELSDEGCLSLPRLYGMVERPTSVVVKARDLSGKVCRMKAEGMLARALVHEIDHLNGELFIDKVDQSTLYWLVGHNEDGEPVTQPTTLEDALRVFTAVRLARRSPGEGRAARRSAEGSPGGGPEDPGTHD